MELSVGNSGWVRMEGGPFLRFVEAEDGRLEIGEIYWAPESAVTAATLRELRLGEIEAAANAPTVADAIRERLRLPGPDLARLASHYATTFSPTTDHWVAMSMRAQTGGAMQPSYGRPPKRNVPFLARVAALKAIPDKNDTKDDFYKSVAAAYSALASESRRPAWEIAEAKGVPITTVHRWVREARRRGFLSPARSGKAG